MRALSCGSADASGAVVEANTGPDEVDRGVQPLGEDRVLLILDLDRGLLHEATVAELVEEDLEPAFAGQSTGRVAWSQPLARVVEGSPGGGEAGPGAGDPLVQPLSEVEVVVPWCEPVEGAVAVSDALEQVCGQQAALGVNGLEQVA